MKFPSIESLAESSQDDVMKIWSGLGYYSRARNLHKTAKIIMEELNGTLPHTIEDLLELPGIGKSTAGAILALGYEIKAPILDANVKRVLARFKAIEGNLKKSRLNNELWLIAESMLPKKEISTYTQAIMDLGATVCTQKKPDCTICPVNLNCLAKEKGLIKEIPKKNIKKRTPIKKVFWLIAKNDKNEFFLKKRSDKGIWSGLWSFPEFSTISEVEKTKRKIFKKTKNIASTINLPIFKHKFSHFILHVKIIFIGVTSDSKCKKYNADYRWLHQNNLDSVGLPSPVKKTIVELSDNG